MSFEDIRINSTYAVASFSVAGNLALLYRSLKQKKIQPSALANLKPMNSPMPKKVRTFGVKQEAKKHCERAQMGVLRLDYEYPPALGDIAHPSSFGYDVIYRTVPGYTFEVCQQGTLEQHPEVMREFKEAVRYLTEDQKVVGVTGDCGFMMWMQPFARSLTHKPVLLSSLAQLPMINCAFGPHKHVIIVTANCSTLKPMLPLIYDEVGVDPSEKRYHIIGAQDVPGFEAVALGEEVDTQKVEPGIVELCQQALIDHPQTCGFLFECTELPHYSNAVRQATGLPVFDAITNTDLFMAAFQDSHRFGNLGIKCVGPDTVNYKYGDKLNKCQVKRFADWSQHYPYASNQ